MQMVFVKDYERLVYTTCFSSNLHLNDDAESDLWDLRVQHIHFPVGMTQSFYATVENKEAFYTWTNPQLYLAIHSPYVPTNPIYEGQALKTGYVYNINIRLEEEHLLPEPYQTNCTDYDDLWRKNNKTGPRSQEVCIDDCEREVFKEIVPTDSKVVMMQFSEIKGRGIADMDGYPEKYKEYEKCKRKCKPSCLKLKYSYSLSERVLEKSKILFFHFDLASDNTLVQTFVFNPEVTITKHIPVYDEEAIFSNVGGLIGCWLGISVWALAGIAETTLWTVVRIFPMLRRHFEQWKRSGSFSKRRPTTVRNF